MKGLTEDLAKVKQELATIKQSLMRAGELMEKHARAQWHGDDSRQRSASDLEAAADQLAQCYTPLAMAEILVNRSF